ncbi:MAG: hypothetical protein AABZ78_11820 [Chloroflexota bacterium]
MSVEQIKLSRNTLSELPNKQAVYGVFAQHKTSRKPVHCRYVGETENLSVRAATHFSSTEPDDRLKEFMQSSKTKLMVYELMPDSTEEERQGKLAEWVTKHHPKNGK